MSAATETSNLETFSRACDTKIFNNSHKSFDTEPESPFQLRQKSVCITEFYHITYSYQLPGGGIARDLCVKYLS